MTAYRSKIATNCEGRAHPRPEQLTADQQAQYYSKYADISCKDCFGHGGEFDSVEIDRGYYTTIKRFFIPCECVTP
jgi:uncharacterized protein YecE (DUF72 family)